MFGVWKRILPDSSFAPLFAFLPTFLGRTHRLPRNPIWLANVFCGSSPALLMNQIKIAERRLLVRIRLKKFSFSRKFVGRRYGIIARVGDVSRSVCFELMSVELK